jgi:hypothetical protein
MNAGPVYEDRGTIGAMRSGTLGTLVAIVLAAVAGCNGSTATPSQGTLPTTGPIDENPTMRSTIPVAEGDWQVLFDGSATDALRGYGMAGFPADRWLVADGELRTVPGPGVDLITRDTFVDFELEFQWRVAPGGNSGVMYRVAETPEPAWTTGPEYQVLDDERHPDGVDPTTSAAALYDLIAPGPDKRLEPVGSFNAGRIVVRDGRVEHFLNGVLVVTYDWDDPATRELVATSKFAPYEGYMAQDSGHVVFQHHGEEAAFRSIRIRSLDGG